METLIIVRIKNRLQYTHFFTYSLENEYTGISEINVELVNSRECMIFSIALDNIKSTGLKPSVRCDGFR